MSEGLASSPRLIFLFHPLLTLKRKAPASFEGGLELLACLKGVASGLKNRYPYRSKRPGTAFSFCFPSAYEDWTM